MSSSTPSRQLLHDLAVAVRVSATRTVKERRPVVVRRYGDLWSHRRAGEVVVHPTPIGLTLAAWRSTVADFYPCVSELAAGDVVFDIGAGIGRETIVFSELVGDSGQVLAVEAHPGTYACLLANISLNERTNITTINAAASGDVGLLDIVGEPGAVDATVVTGVNPDAVQVPTVRLDDMVEALDGAEVALVKMNIEGAETAALSGLTRSLEARRLRRVHVACHDFIADQGGPDDVRTKQPVTEFLQSFGYSVESVHGPDRPPYLQDHVLARPPAG